MHKYFPNWFGGWIIIIAIFGTIFIGIPYVVYCEIEFAKNCPGTYRSGRPSLCISKDGRILNVK